VEWSFPQKKIKIPRPFALIEYFSIKISLNTSFWNLHQKTFTPGKGPDESDIEL
jgi:hypothetical protein